MVNGSDFALLAANFGKSASGWDKGDLNNDNTVNGSDFALLAGNFGKSASGTSVLLPPSDWDALDAFAADHGLLADVPEPTSAGLLFIGMTAPLLARGRRRSIAG